MNEISQLSTSDVAALIALPCLLVFIGIIAYLKIKKLNNIILFLTESIPDIVWRLDANYVVTFVSSADKRLRGFDSAEVVGTSILKYLTDNSKSLIGMLKEVREDEASRGIFVKDRIVEVELLRKNNSPITMEVVLNYEYNGKYLKGFSGVARDITIRKHTEDELYFMANNDALTKLSNRRSFMEMANREFESASRYGKPLSVLMLDIDKFKLVNDTYGHHAGDVVLQHMAEVGVKQLRNTDVLGRLGGEEFAVLATDTEIEGAVQTAEKLRRAYEKVVVKTDGHTITFTISIGVTTLVPSDKSFETMLKRADAFLYEAKETGRNKTVFFKG